MRTHALKAVAAWAAASLALSCGAPPSAPSRSAKSLFPPAPARAPATAKPSALEQIQIDARAVEPLLRTAFAKRFVAATAALPHVATRVVFQSADKQRAFTKAEAAALPEAERATLKVRELDEEVYYNTNYGSPLSYSRPLDLLAAAKLIPEGGGRILDFGYGYIGHLRLLASLGFDANGVDVDPLLRALYAEPGDQGPIAGYGGAPAGKVRLFSGRYPADARLAADIGAGYDIIISKNVLKKGYIHPDRPADEKLLIKLGVDDAAMLRALHDAVKPGGAVLLYNICPALTPPDKPFVPWSDGRSPFTEAQWAAAGFELREFNRDDADAIRALGRALAWDKPDGGDPGMDLEHDLSVLYTLAVRSR